MNRRSTRLVLLLYGASIWATAVAALSQQVADSSFDAKVANPAYVKEHPRVLFDEAHFNFHTTTGRYSPFVNLITNDGYQVSANKEKFSSKILGSFTILVMANAQDSTGRDVSAFTEEECDAVRDWVKVGGSLLLIADHQPWGAANANLSKQFGVDMKSVFTVDTVNYDREATRSTGSPPYGFIVYTREKGLDAAHPITRGRDERERVNRVVTFTGQSLKGPNNSRVFLKLDSTAQDVDRSGQISSAAGRAQGIALEFGKGRVVVLGEAAMLTAQVAGPQKIPFGMNRPGNDNRQLALNIMHWLSGVLN